MQYIYLLQFLSFFFLIFFLKFFLQENKIAVFALIPYLTSSCVVTVLD